MNSIKRVCFLLVLLYSTKGIAQDTTFYNDKWKEVKSLNKATRYKVVKKYSDGYTASDKDRASEKFYTRLGQLVQQQEYSSYINLIVDGEVKKWFDNGRFRAEIHYKNDTLIDSLITYWKNGQLKRKDKYDKQGKLLGGICYDSAGKEVTHYDYKKGPVFTYDRGDLNRYFFNNVKYPRGDARSGIGGTMVVSFIVGADGSISHVMVKKSSGDRDLDNAALDTFTEMPLWEPAMEDGEPVRLTYTYPIKFVPGW